MLNFNGFLFGSEILRQRLHQPNQKECAFETLVEEIPVILEVVPGQIAAKFARRYRRDDKYRVLWPDLIRHGERQYLMK